MSTILLIEDDEMSRDMISRQLSRKGFEIIIATDGEQGVNLATSHVPDLILMDLSLPVMDGWEAARRLKAAPVTSGIPIVALTAHAMAGDQDKAIQAGCDDYISKPVELQGLVAKIEEILAARAAG